jgi:thioredoxin reductase (NADPH)
MAERWESIIVGAGPAGLSAALYLARYRRSALVLHDGASRALRVPLTHNVPGGVDAFSGVELLATMTRRAESYGARIARAHVERAERNDDGYSVFAEGGECWRSRTLLLATGVDMNEISLEPVLHEEAIRRGVLRYCPICDGFEHIGQRIGVLGCDSQGAAEALFLRQYSEHIVLFPRSYAALTAACRAQLAKARIAVVEQPARHFLMRGDEMLVEVDGRAEPLVFDVVYPALGLRPRNQLAASLGLELDEKGNVGAQAPYGTKLPGLFAIGDIVAGLDQISVALGHGAIAATKAHNWLREQDGHCLQS